MVRRISWQLAATAALLVLLGVLGTLQYRWLGDVSQAERDRMRAALQTRVSDFTEAFDREVTRAWAAFQLPLTGGDAGAARDLAEAYGRWESTAPVPGVVAGVYLVEVGDTGSSVHRLDVAHGTLAPAALPPAFANWTARIAGAKPDEATPGPLLAGPIEPTTPALVVPAPRVQVVGGGGRRVTYLPAAGPTRFVIVALDAERLRRDLLAPLAARYFDQGPGAAYDVTVVARDRADDRVFALPSSAAVTAADADLTGGLFDLRLEELGRLAAAGAPAPDVSREHLAITIVRRNGQRESRVAFGASGGIWQVRVRSRAGSLDALVQRSRRRNLAIGFGVLLLLAASFGLVLAAAARQQRLARQQIEFVASVSHELRTPLAVICSAGENLADGVVAGAEQVRQYGSLIGTEGRRLADMVERVMTYAGIASGAAARPHGDVDLAAVIEEAVAGVAPEARARGVGIRVAVAPSLPPLEGDAGALRSALQNLVGNAVKYSPGGADVEVAAEGGGGIVRVRVGDRGLGIDAADLPHVFKPFFRGRRAVDAQARGSGIGLSVVRHVVEAHRGRVHVDSRPGDGTTVTIDLPAAGDPAVGVSDAVRASRAPV